MRPFFGGWSAKFLRREEKRCRRTCRPRGPRTLKESPCGATRGTGRLLARGTRPIRRARSLLRPEGRREGLRPFRLAPERRLRDPVHIGRLGRCEADARARALRREDRGRAEGPGAGRP